MKDATATVGTSLEVLQHYLTTGIILQSCYDDGTEEFQVVLLGLEHRNDGWLAKVQYSDRETGFVPLDYWLPLLRPFSVLVEPLPDGTIPAAIQMLREIGYTDAHYIKQQRTGTLAVYSALDEPVTRIFHDWGIGPDSLTLRWAEVCWKYHFALPVNGRHLVEGVDFVPLSPTTPATEKDS